MPKKIGYLNIFFILFIPFLMYHWIDFSNLSTPDWIVIGLYSVVVMIFIVRVVLVIKRGKDT